MKTIAFTLIIFLLLIGCQSRQNNRTEITTENQSEQEIDQKKSLPEPVQLSYDIVAKQDISYENTPRMVYRVKLNVDSIPEDRDIKFTAEKIWDDGNEALKEFTVFMYLPEMNTELAAFGVGEFNPNGLVSFDINENALYGTKWEIKTTDDAVSEVPDKVKNEYYIDIHAVNDAGNIVKIKIESNFPDGTNLLLTIGRTHYLKGEQGEYSGELLTEKFTLENGIFETVALINDSEWYNEHQRLVRALPDDISPISKISDNIKISVLYTPATDQPQNVVNILGKNGEFVYGEGSSKFGKMRTFRNSIELSMPFKNN